ncbi:hypothetical protein [Verminephrobacter eiseniae]|nr:hypothetical protein [Verminephrobacter eiseniae]
METLLTPMMNGCDGTAELRAAISHAFVAITDYYLTSQIYVGKYDKI